MGSGSPGATAAAALPPLPRPRACAACCRTGAGTRGSRQQHINNSHACYHQTRAAHVALTLGKHACRPVPWTFWAHRQVVPAAAVRLTCRCGATLPPAGALREARGWTGPCPRWDPCTHTQQQQHHVRLSEPIALSKPLQTMLVLAKHPHAGATACAHNVLLSTAPSQATALQPCFLHAANTQHIQRCPLCMAGRVLGAHFLALRLMCSTNSSRATGQAAVGS